MSEYTLGFLFGVNYRTEVEEVLLIKKTHPEFQANKFNGIGGKIEDEYYNLKEMSDIMNGRKREPFKYQKEELARKFKEETNIDLNFGWNLFSVLHKNPLGYSELRNKFSIYCFYAIYYTSLYHEHIYNPMVKSPIVRAFEEETEKYLKPEDKEFCYIVPIKRLDEITFVDYTKPLLHMAIEKANNLLKLGYDNSSKQEMDNSYLNIEIVSR